MSPNRTHWAALAILSTLPAPAQPPSAEPVAEVENIKFYSNELLNLHHTLYAAAWASRPAQTGTRVLAQKLPHALTASFTPQERAVWDQAVRYYDAQIADRDPLNGPGMERMKAALVSGNLSDPAINDDLRATLEAASPIFERYFWPEQDRVNRAWIPQITERVNSLAPPSDPTLTIS